MATRFVGLPRETIGPTPASNPWMTDDRVASNCRIPASARGVGVALLVAAAACTNNEPIPASRALPVLTSLPGRHELDIRADLQSLCYRVATESLGSWGEPAVLTAEVRALTGGIVAGNLSARCELGRLMLRYAPKECSESTSGLSRNCSEPVERPRVSPEP